MKLGKTAVAEPMPSLFKAEKVNYQTPELSTTVLEDAFDQMELLGFPLCSPFFLLLNPGGNTLRARQLMAQIEPALKAGELQRARDLSDEICQEHCR